MSVGEIDTRYVRSCSRISAGRGLRERIRYEGGFLFHVHRARRRPGALNREGQEPD